jgi:hypothetical protein
LTGTSINPPGTPCQVRQRVPGFFLLALTSAGVIAADLSPDRMDFLTATSSAHRLPGPFRPVRKHFVVSLQVTSLAVSIALGRAQAEQGRELDFADERRVVTRSGQSEKGTLRLLIGLCGLSRHTMRTAGMERSPDVRKKSTLNCCIHLLATAEYGRVDMGRAIRRLALSVPTFFAPSTRSVVPACGGCLQSLPVAMP